jgi:predicted DCC family thiol-disulfide oxidoreductase YuxK
MAGVLLYDADCAFCTRAASAVPRLRLSVGVCSLQSVDLPGLGVDPDRARRELPFVDGAGAVSYGHAAVANALRTGPLLLRLVGTAMTLPGLNFVFASLYRLVAANRHRLPGGSAACELPPV